MCYNETLFYSTHIVDDAGTYISLGYCFIIIATPNIIGIIIIMIVIIIAIPIVLFAFEYSLCILATEDEVLNKANRRKQSVGNERKVLRLSCVSQCFN